MKTSPDWKPFFNIEEAENFFGKVANAAGDDAKLQHVSRANKQSMWIAKFDVGGSPVSILVHEIDIRSSQIPDLAAKIKRKAVN